MKLCSSVGIGVLAAVASIGLVASQSSAAPPAHANATSAESAVRPDTTLTLTILQSENPSVPGQSELLQAVTNSPCSITGYSWDLGDGTTTSGPTTDNVTHAWSAVGNYSVKVTATDACGDTATVTFIQAVVQDDPPIAVFTPRVYAATPLRVYADPDASSDNDPTGIDSMAWAWGDGTRSDGYWDLGNDNTYQHNYTQAGTYYIALRLADTAGNSSTVTQPVTTAQPAPNTEETASSVKYTGTWALGNCGSSACSADRKQKYTTTSGSKATFTYKGTSADWVGSVGTNAGTAKVFVDGVLKATVSLASPDGIQDGVLLFAGTKMKSGSHTLTIQQTTGRVNIDALRIHS